ncbi:type II secretion system protein [Halorubrum aidingense JCM 13560]|uniref:Type II secretion system protein n=1 Tax=Halorubrum aidingense JCM 13560 TaxID=1230454 RepID=M0PHA3_9EURY|nr:type II secretion system F family protein [Halorubrum aidingense]EMA68964.1 type II secretion system protein [Halorubrum aidingense JCM 13560]
MSLDTGVGDGSADGDVIAELFYPVFELLFDADGDFVGDVERKLAEARMPDHVEMYVSRALGAGLLVGGLLWALGTTVGYGVFSLGLIDPNALSLGMPAPTPEVRAFLRSLVVPTAILISGLVFGSIGFATGFGGVIAIPYSRASSRKREINLLLADSVSFMYALSVGGLNQLEILRAMATAEDTYGEVSREFQSIVNETEYFGTDYRNAIRQQSLETPSDELSQFLADMLSIVNSGGNMESFLKDKKEKHLRTSKQEREMTLETLELFGEMYMTLSLFPLLLIIILVIMGMMGEADDRLLYATVYVLIPLTGAGFLVLVSTVKQDEPGDGYLRPDGGSERLRQTSKEGLFHFGLIEAFVGTFSVFDRIREREGTYKTTQIVSAPHLFLRDNPLYTLAFTIPAAFVIVGVAAATGNAPTTFDGWVDRPVWSAFVWVYVPAYLVMVPLAVFYEWSQRSKRAITGKLSESLRKLSSANDTGQTLLESVQTVSETSTGQLAEEFEVVHAKVNYGMSLRDALVEFNNSYAVPRLARTVKLISEAQEASSQITDVLTTAAQASENQDDIDRERKSRTRMQVAIIVMTYITLLGVMAILQTQFIEVMGDLVAQGSSGGGGQAGNSQFGGGGVDPDVLSMLFFHAVTIQAVLSGFISGYIRDAEIISGVKFAVILMTLALGVWIYVG